MTETTYTMFIPKGAGADEIVARNVTAGRALAIALDHGRDHHSTIACRSGGSHRVYEIARPLPNLGRQLVMAVKLPRSSDETADAFLAADVFVEIFLSDPTRFWKGEIVTDEEFARHRAH